MQCGGGGGGGREIVIMFCAWHCAAGCIDWCGCGEGAVREDGGGWQLCFGHDIVQQVVLTSIFLRLMWW